MSNHNHIAYDLESYPDIFTCCIGDMANENHYVYEISTRKNEFKLLLQALLTLKENGTAMVGYNNISYDYPMLHFLLKNATAETGNLPGGDIAYMMWQKNEEIFKSAYGSFTSVYENDVLIPQIDLMKINHFDNNSRRTSLKCLEFKMRSQSIQDLPFEPGVPIGAENMDALCQYNIKDVRETIAFYHHCLKAIQFRMDVGPELGMDIMNFNDTKIGAQYFVNRLEAELGGDICYTKKGRSKKPNQTKRDQIELAEVINSELHFKRPEFKAIYDWLRAQVISETKGVFTDIDMLDPNSEALVQFLPDIQEMLIAITKQKNMNLADGENKKTVKKISKRTQVKLIETGEILYTYTNEGSKKRLDSIRSEYTDDQLQYEVLSHKLPKLAVPFSNSTDKPDGEHIPSKLGDVLMIYGTGGLHASVHNKAVHSDEEWLIIDADVTSYYPSMFLATGAYPEHLTDNFIPIYKSLIEERLQHPKGSVENAALKLALNGVYGKTNDKYSPFFDPACMLKITLNGQLYLTMLIEDLKEKLGEDVELIQANTDGITCLVRRKQGAEFAKICQHWCAYTNLKLEYAAYDHMYIKDVNNYLAVIQGGKTKAIGKYADPVPSDVNYKGDWAKNHSNLVVYQTAVQKLLNPELDIGEAIRSHGDLFDFMFYIKASGATLKRMEMHYTAEGFDEPHVIQKRSRFIVTTQGGRLYKVLAPTATNPEKDRHVGEKAGKLVTLANDISDEFAQAVWPIIDYNYYINEVEKLLALEEVS